MAKRWFLLASMAAVLLSYSVVKSADEAKDAKYKPVCPVSGKPAIEAQAVAYKGAKVYFCCENCPKAFSADTKKYAAKANLQLAGTGQAKETKCPLAGRDLNPATAIDVSGVKVAFCCNNCKGAAEKATDKVALIFADEKFDKAYTIQKAAK